MFKLRHVNYVQQCYNLTTRDNLIYDKEIIEELYCTLQNIWCLFREHMMLLMTMSVYDLYTRGIFFYLKE